MVLSCSVLGYYLEALIDIHVCDKLNYLILGKLDVFHLSQSPVKFIHLIVKIDIVAFNR